MREASLYFITDTEQCAAAGRSVADTVFAAVSGGADIVQVRDKNLPDASFADLVKECRAAIQKTERKVPLFINDRVELAAQLIKDGYPVHVHIGQDDAAPEQVRELVGPDAMIGLSAGTVAEVKAAPDVVDLLGIGLAFDTTTKDVPTPALGPEGLAELVAATDLPCFAIGGIDLAGAAQLSGIGLSGICVVSAICTAADPQTVATRLKQAIQSGRAT